MRLARLALKRLAASLPGLAIILVGLCLILELAPGDSVDALMSQMGSGDDALATTLREYYGLNRTVTVRLVTYLWHLLHLDLGTSVQFGSPVVDLIFQRMPVTLVLMGSALMIAFVLGSAIGILAARHVNGWQDTLTSALGLIFYATPSFWFGLMGILLFAVELQWLPAGGLTDLSANYTGMRFILDAAVHLILPTATLALIYLAIYLRIMRASMLEVLALDFVRTARAKGASESAVLVSHALRNALLPLITIVGLQAGSMLGGAVVVESVFSLPGLGRLSYEAVVNRDLNLLLGIVFMSSILVIIVNFIVDMLYAWLDPRIDATV
jgi:peptide/nickel transport system permease protein